MDMRCALEARHYGTRSAEPSHKCLPQLELKSELAKRQVTSDIEDYCNNPIEKGIREVEVGRNGWFLYIM